MQSVRGSAVRDTTYCSCSRSSTFPEVRHVQAEFPLPKFTPHVPAERRRRCRRLWRPRARRAARAVRFACRSASRPVRRAPPDPGARIAAPSARAVRRRRWPRRKSRSSRTPTPPCATSSTSDPSDPRGFTHQANIHCWFCSVSSHAGPRQLAVLRLASRLSIFPRTHSRQADQRQRVPPAVLGLGDLHASADAGRVHLA